MFKSIRKPLSARAFSTYYKSTSKNVNLIEVIDITGSTEEKVLWWQYYISTIGSDRLLIASTSAHDFLVNCCSLEVKKRINDSYNSLHSNFKGGATYLYYMLKSVFVTDKKIRTNLELYLPEGIASKGLRQLRGKIVITFTELALFNAYLLKSVGSDLDELPLQLVKGLVNSSIHHYFKQFYKLAVIQAEIGDYYCIKEFHGIAINALTPVQLTEGIARQVARRYMKAKNNNEWAFSGRGGDPYLNMSLTNQGEDKMKYTKSGLKIRYYPNNKW